jgi:branched-chain amino acid transport system permease protein
MAMSATTTPARRPLTGQWLVRGRWPGRLFLGLLLALVVWKLVDAFMAGPSVFVQQLINGLQLGFVYALIALGYTMVYGIVRLINFAHGDVFMVGAFISYFAISDFRLHEWPSRLLPGIPEGASVAIGTFTVMALSMLVCAILAVVIERTAYKPLRDAPRISALITAIGVSFFLEYFGALDFVFTPSFITYERPFPVQTYYIQDGIHALEAGQTRPEGVITFSNILVIIVVVSLALLLMLNAIVRRTKTGKAMRAVAFDKPTARLMGIDVSRTISVTFALGAALAGAGGMLYAIAFPSIVFWMGIIPGLKAFIAAVLGGIGSLPGAFFGALIMGQAETLAGAYISSPMRDAIAFTLLIIVLLYRPRGLFGEPEREKA